MSEQVLYRKHRPRGFEEVVGQEHVVGALKNSLERGRIAHAYLFSGPRGVGKTTIARLIAKALNCEQPKDRPCNICSSCTTFNSGRAVDLIEIDAASNRGIDEIRELREGVRFMPTQGKYKTYIIDEVHMLTKEAFNALLKTLEEPPAHAVFVLATTELDKVPATIVSRTQQYAFRRPVIEQIINRLSLIAKKEEVGLDNGAARLIATAAEGGLRDAESILGQIIAVEDNYITRETVESVLGLPRGEQVRRIFTSIAGRDAPAALRTIQELHDNGVDLAQVSKMLLRYFRAALFLKADPALRRFFDREFMTEEIDHIAAKTETWNEQDLHRAISCFVTNMTQFKKTPIPQLPLELAAIETIAGMSPPTKEV